MACREQEQVLAVHDMAWVPPVAAWWQVQHMQQDAESYARHAEHNMLLLGCILVCWSMLVLGHIWVPQVVARWQAQHVQQGVDACHACCAPASERQHEHSREEHGRPRLQRQRGRKQRQEQAQPRHCQAQHCGLGAPRTPQRQQFAGKVAHAIGGHQQQRVPASYKFNL
jgi:hypothetical protein